MLRLDLTRTGAYYADYCAIDWRLSLAVPLLMLCRGGASARGRVQGERTSCRVSWPLQRRSPRWWGGARGDPGAAPTGLLTWRACGGAWAPLQPRESRGSGPQSWNLQCILDRDSERVKMDWIWCVDTGDSRNTFLMLFAGKACSVWLPELSATVGFEPGTTRTP